MHDSRLHGDIEDVQCGQYLDRSLSLLSCGKELETQSTYTSTHNPKCTACLGRWRTTDRFSTSDTAACRSPSSTSTIFSNSNLVVMGGNFVAAIQHTTGKPSYIISPQSKLHTHQGWNKLADTIPTDVLHDSASRYAAPRCADGQYEDVRAKILDTLEDEAYTRRIIWVHGPSDTSLIAQSTTEACISSNIQPVTFFFTTTAEEQYALFVPTLAYQLCLLIHGARSMVGQVIDNDPTILSRSPFVQLGDLILLPLKQLFQAHSRESPPRLVVIVEGLERCSATQQQVLVEVIAKTVDKLPFPITLILFSKRSVHIHRTFTEHLGPTGRNYITEIATTTSGSRRGHVDSRLLTVNKGFIYLLPLLATVSYIMYFRAVTLCHI